MRIPEQGRSRPQVFADLEAFRGGDVDWRSGRTWGYVYDPDGEAMDVCKQAFTMYLTENGLDPTAFPSAVKLERDVVAMVAGHLNAPEGAVGNFTSGGTESIILACKVARDRFHQAHPDVARPEVLLPVTAHAAFHKACHYLGLEAVLVEVDDAYRADVSAMRAALTPRTCLLVGSAASYAHGVVDPIPELGRLALEAALPLHVDACIGGFILPYFRRFGATFPDFDLSVPGVTSISCDLHKYAFTAKGASVVVYRHRSDRRHQIYACARWTGYTVVNNTIQSSKSAGPMAAAWAVMNYLGDDGYEQLMRRMYDATHQICEGISAIPGLRLLAWPDTNLVAFGGEEGVDVFHVADEMKTRGWYVQPQLGFAGSPANLHLSINPKADRWVDAMLTDLAASVEAARALPSGHAAAFVREAFGQIDPGTFDEETFAAMLGAAGLDGVELPERMAGVNEMLEALDPQLREQVLVEFLNTLYV